MPISPVKDGPWPPKSPRELLLTTPGGRKRIAQRREQLMRSPSPSARRTPLSILKRPVGNTAPELDPESDGSEDEETLKLKLAAIEARLKLKKLQKAKNGAGGSSQDSTPSGTIHQTGIARPVSTYARQLAAQVMVPASPKRRPRQDVPASPSRVLLGIDKGLHARDVSLRRVPAAKSDRPSKHLTVGRAAPTPVATPVQSFSDRLNSLKSKERNKEQRLDLVSQTRNRAFGLDIDQRKQFQQVAAALPAAETQSRTTQRSAFSRSDILDRERERTPEESKPSESADYSFEAFSETHLSRRIIPHMVLTRTLAGKKTYSIPDVLKEVKGPEYLAPDIVEDWVVFGIIASKSSPYDRKSNEGSGKSKFMVIHLTDLKWELDLFLFGTGFETFWKLTPGTLIAILNPGVMPPTMAKKDTGKFSLSLDSSEDTVLEIGQARDLGFCKSIKKDGKHCTQWVDMRHTEFCEYHVNLRLEKVRAGRMEVNTISSTGLFGGSNGSNGGKGDSFKKRPFNKRKGPAGNQPRPDLPEYMGGAGGVIHIIDTRVTGRTVAALLDDDDIDPDAFHRGTTKEERLRRRLAAKEKETGIAKRLAGLSRGGVGAEYLRQAHGLPSVDCHGQSNMNGSGDSEPPLSIQNNRGASDVHLSPIKRKRQASNDANSTGTWTARKKTRFLTERGIRIAGRDSIGEQTGKGQRLTLHDYDDDEDDGLDIVM